MAKLPGKIPNMMPKTKFAQTKPKGPPKSAKAKPGKYDGDDKMGKY